MSLLPLFGLQVLAYRIFPAFPHNWHKHYLSNGLDESACNFDPSLFFISFESINAQLNYTKCAAEAVAAYQNSPNSSFLVDAGGKITYDLHQANGVSYTWCEKHCGSSDNYDHYTWDFFSQGILTWLVPWLALIARFPFGTRSKAMNFWALCLTIGSPALAAYSLALTLLNSRSVNKKFRRLKEVNKSLHGSRQLELIKGARVLLIESQSCPINVSNGPQREFAQLIVRLENLALWRSIRIDLLASQKERSFALYAQIGVVCTIQIWTIINYFVYGALDTDIWIGLAINSLWTWELPVVIGWFIAGTQECASSITAASTAHLYQRPEYRVALEARSLSIRDRTLCDPFALHLRAPSPTHNHSFV